MPKRGLSLIFLRVSERDRDFLKTLAEDEGVSVATLLRRAVNEDLERKQLPVLEPVRQWKRRRG